MRARLTMILASCLLLSIASTASAQRRVDVASSDALVAAITAAAPGDDIVLADGTYEVTNRVACRTAGTAAQPIRVRAARRGGALVRFMSDGGYVEGFYVAAPRWTFEDLVVEGRCADDSRCEHVFHLVGDADFTTIRGSVLRDVNAQVKSNGLDVAGVRVYPDDVLVEGNELYDTAPRRTSNPVTPIDVVGGRRWLVRGNYIHDHQKALGDTISYAAFFKGNSRDGVFERNLVVCEQLHTGGVRLGLSFGGGGSSPDPICEDGTCTPEHQSGIMRNNVIAHCPADVGIYVNECAGCVIAHNTILDATGIDLRFAETDVVVTGNLTSGRIRDRDGARSARSANVEGLTAADWAAIFVDAAGLDFTIRDGARVVGLGAPRADVPDDFCGRRRDDGAPDLGAIEYVGGAPCDVRWMGPRTEPTPTDAGPSDLDAGTAMTVDAGPITAPDAGPITAPDAGATSPTSGGCACRVAGRTTRVEGALVALVAMGLATTRRARRRR